MKEVTLKLPNPYNLIEVMLKKITEELDDDTCLIGIPAGGALIINELKKKIKGNIKYGLIDGSFYRDDLEISGVKVKDKITSIDFDVDGKKIILIDDIFYTGRTTRAAINEIFDYGRPKEIKLYVLIDRQHNELPIKPDYVAFKIKQPKNISIDLINNKNELTFKIRKINDKPSNI